MQKELSYDEKMEIFTQKMGIIWDEEVFDTMGEPEFSIEIDEDFIDSVVYGEDYVNQKTKKNEI